MTECTTHNAVLTCCTCDKNVNATAMHCQDSNVLLSLFLSMLNAIQFRPRRSKRKRHNSSVPQTGPEKQCNAPSRVRGEGSGGRGNKRESETIFFCSSAQPYRNWFLTNPSFPMRLRNVSVETYLVNTSAGLNLVPILRTCSNPLCTRFCMYK